MAGFEGFAPTVTVAPTMSECAKYERLWQLSEYRQASPGESWSLTFLTQARVEKDAEVIDFGCGTGRGGLALALVGGLRVQMLDFASNCLDPEVAEACHTQADRIRFDVADLTKPIQHTAAYGYCCDVMEHIPPALVPTVLTNILASAQHVFFAISTVPDEMGALIGEQLHLTVQPMAWWIEQLRAAGALIHWSSEAPGACAIYCTAWKSPSDVLPDGVVNVDTDQLERNVLANVAAGWLHVQPHDRQDREVILLAGGPSMLEDAALIKEMRAAGAALVTVNGAYKWALANGLQPSAQIVLDARPFNARFTRPIVDGCRYLIASQVDPSVLEGLPRERTFLWHSALSEQAERAVYEHEDGFYFPIPGGSTVVLRALPLLRLLGLWRLHLFGFDSCLLRGRHHAYDQPENDGEQVVPVTCGGRVFECTPWMLHQATEFMDLVRFLGDEVELEIHGDGLIAHIARTGAELSNEE